MRIASASPLKQMILDHLRKVKRRLLLSAVCMIGVTATELLTSWPFKMIFDYIARLAAAAAGWLKSSAPPGPENRPSSA